MLYEEFIADVRKALYERMDNVTVMEEEMLKNNGLHYPTLLVKENDDKVGVNFYPEALFLQYSRNEITLSEVVDQIIDSYKTKKLDFKIDTEAINNYDLMKCYIKGRLINTKKNPELLATLPHREFLDLSIIYTIELRPTIEHEIGYIKISNALMEAWSVDEETLYQQMMENMRILKDGTIKSMATVMEELVCLEPMLLPSVFPLYVVSNHTKIFGAIEILNKEVLEKASTMLGGDFYIIPSSLHECLLIPSHGNAEDANHFRSMIQEVNDSHVSNEDILSYNLYQFRQETGEIEIAA